MSRSKKAKLTALALLLVALIAGGSNPERIAALVQRILDGVNIESNATLAF